MMTYQEALKHFKSLQKRYTTQHNGVMCEKVEVAIEAIEKQIPKKVLPDKKYYGVGKCPVCGVVFFHTSLITPFCGNCGQAIDWSDNDDPRNIQSLPLSEISCVKVSE